MLLQAKDLICTAKLKDTNSAVAWKQQQNKTWQNMSHVLCCRVCSLQCLSCVIQILSYLVITAVITTQQLYLG